MQTKIKNPYTDIVQTAGDTMHTKDLHYAIMQANVFAQGVQAALAATKPRRFADEQPSEQQEVILFGDGRGPVMQVFLSWNVSEGTYKGYTHWLPYPELL